MNYTHLRALARLELPDPVPGGLQVQDYLQDLPLPLRVLAFERLALGVERYGVPLAALDGRDPRRALPAFGHVGTQTSRQLQVQVSHKDMLLQITVDDGALVGQQVRQIIDGEVV